MFIDVKMENDVIILTYYNHLLTYSHGHYPKNYFIRCPMINNDK